MPPEFLIAEFQELLRPVAPLLTLVNRIWGFGAGLLLPALVFWLGGAERGFRAAWITALSGCLNTLLKWALAIPRPFYVTDRFTPLKLTDGYGMPSGNAQGPVTLLLTLAKNGPGWIWAVGAPLVLLAGVARVYYGVHSVDQVLIGWALGIAIAWVAMAAERPLAGLVKRLRPRRRVGLLLLATGLLFAIWYGVAAWSLDQKPYPPEWKQRFDHLAVELDEGDEQYSLVVPAEAGAIAGYLLGFGLVGLGFLARGLPALRRGRERWLAVAIGLAANFLWGRAASAIIGELASLAGGIALALLLVPLVATLPPLLFLGVPAVARWLAARRGSS